MRNQDRYKFNDEVNLESFKIANQSMFIWALIILKKKKKSKEEGHEVCGLGMYHFTEKNQVLQVFFGQDIRSTHLFDELGGHVAHHGEEVEAQEACNGGEVLGRDEEVVT